jgi:hypothetical protein
VQKAPVGNGFFINDDDLRFIFKQIQVSQANAARGALLGPGPNQVNSQADPNGDPQLPMGLRTVDGSYNNLVPIPDQHMFGAADLVFPRKTTPVFRDAEALPFDPDGAGPQAAGQSTSYKQKAGFVSDSQPRLISNLIVDQSANNRRRSPRRQTRADRAASSARAPLRPILIPARCSFQTSRRISASPRRST